MPIVPFSKAARETLGRDQGDLPVPPLPWGLIAAAQMHTEGRLIEQRGTEKLPASTNIEDRRGNPTEGDHVDAAGLMAALRTRRSVLSRKGNQPAEAE